MDIEQNWELRLISPSLFLNSIYIEKEYHIKNGRSSQFFRCCYCHTYFRPNEGISELKVSSKDAFSIRMKQKKFKKHEVSYCLSNFFLFHFAHNFAALSIYTSDALWYSSFLLLHKAFIHQVCRFFFSLF